MATGVDSQPSGPVLPTVAVVVPTRNRVEHLDEIVEPLLRDPATTEIVVVNDGSSDATALWLERRTVGDPRFRAVHLGGAGPGRARAAGVEAATAEVVVLLDDDVVAAADLVTRHARHHVATRDLVVCGHFPVVLRPDSPAPVRVYSQAYDHWVEWVTAHPEDVLPGLWMGNISARRGDLLRVPLFADAFDGRKGHQDREFGLRCVKAGLRGIFDPAIGGAHHYQRDIAAFRRDQNAYGRGRVLLHRLHGDLLGPLPEDLTEAGLPPLARGIVRLTDHPAMYRVVTSGLTLATIAEDSLHLWALAELTTRVLARVERRNGAAALNLGDRVPAA